MKTEPIRFPDGPDAARETKREVKETSNKVLELSNWNKDVMGKATGQAVLGEISFDKFVMCRD